MDDASLRSAVSTLKNRFWKRAPEVFRCWGRNTNISRAAAELRRAQTVERYFLNSFAKADRASVGAPDEVCFSTTLRAVNSSQVLRAFLFTIFTVMGLLHSKRAPGSK